MNNNIICTSCKKIVMPPVWQCKNQHIYCGGCLIPLCSVCEECLATPTRNLLVEDLIKNSEDLPCMYLAEGCDFVGRFIDLSHHQTICEFSDVPSQCMIKPCAQKFRKRAMIDHLLAHHKAKNSNSKIVDGKFSMDIFKQISNEEEWKCSQWCPGIFRRDFEDEERAYLVQVWSEDEVLYVEVFSLTNNSEPIRYLMKMPNDKSNESDRGRYVLISSTATAKESPPILSLPVMYALKNYGYLPVRGDIKAITLQFQLPSKDFYNF